MGSTRPKAWDTIHVPDCDALRRLNLGALPEADGSSSSPAAPAFVRMPKHVKATLISSGEEDVPASWRQVTDERKD